MSGGVDDVLKNRTVRSRVFVGAFPWVAGVWVVITGPLGAYKGIRGGVPGTAPAPRNSGGEAVQKIPKGGGCIGLDT